MSRLSKDPEEDETELMLKQKFGTGALLYAFDNERIDYWRLAVECGRRIDKHWRIPVSVVTDQATAQKMPPGVFDHTIVVSEDGSNKRFYQDYTLNMSFRNRNRCDAMLHTPYEFTVMVDTDFLVQGRTVLDAWGKRDLAISKAAYSVCQPRELPADMVYMSEQNRIDMFWATIVCWRARSSRAQTFFKNWRKVVDNYQFYSSIYKFAKEPMRNDFAATVALEMLRACNSSMNCVLQYSIPTLPIEHELVRMEPMLARSKDGTLVSVYSDLHVMNKKSLLGLLT